MRRWVALRQAQGRLLALPDIDSIAGCAALETMCLVEAGAGAVTWLGPSEHGGPARLALVHGGRCDAVPEDDGLPNVLAVPIRHRGRILGVLEALDPPAGGFAPEAREMLDGLAESIALAYERVFRGPRPVDPPLVGVLFGLGIAIVGPVAVAHVMWGEAVAGLCGMCALVGLAVASATSRTAPPTLAPRLTGVSRPPMREGMPHASG